MAYVEIIKIQTGPTTQPALDMIRAVVAQQSDMDLNSYKILKNRSIANELMVILNWKSDRQAPWGSPLAQGLVQEFRRLGLVDHSLWTDFPSPAETPQPD
ncbi:MAG: hypothetical protein WBG37_13570 [Desulfobacterales bacterium]